MSDRKCEFFLLATGIKRRPGITRTGVKVVCSDALGDLAPLYEAGVLEHMLEVPRSNFVAGNYNRARVIIRRNSSLDWSPLIRMVEAKKDGEQFHYVFTVEVPGVYHKSWPVTSSKPLDLRNRESFKDILTNTSKFECKDEDEAELATYFPFTVKHQNSWLDVNSIEMKKIFVSMPDMI